MDLRWLFLDMNSFFTSCEQQEDPRLRGRPVAVAPMDTDSTCCLAASYEAKAYGIRTGTNIGEARRMCPDLVIVLARHEIYSEYHRQILRLLKSMLPNVRKLSVDEMACPLYEGNERSEADAVKLALRIKHAMRDYIGEHMFCSMGLAPNAFLAKVATELHKPNGLVVLRKSDLPGPLLGLQLNDFPGIGRRMLIRLHRCGIQTVQEMYGADRWLLRLAWGGVLGERWWYMIRGSKDCDYGALGDSDTKSVGHSHVLPPEMRNSVGAEGVLLRLTARAVRRMRMKGYHARAISIYIRHTGKQRTDTSHWSASSEHRTPAADPFSLVAAARDLWHGRPAYIRERTPTQVGMVLFDLVPNLAVTLPLFDQDRRNEEAAQAMDKICARFGKSAIDVGSVFFTREGTRDAIAFGKVTDDGHEEWDQTPFEKRLGQRNIFDRSLRELLRV